MLEWINFILLVIILSGLVSPAWAYIDPGTGIAVATGIGAWIMGAVAFCLGFLSLTYKKWVGFIRKIFGRFRKDAGEPKE